MYSRPSEGSSISNMVVLNDIISSKFLQYDIFAKYFASSFVTTYEYFNALVFCRIIFAFLFDGAGFN